MSKRLLTVAIITLIGCADPGGAGVAQSIPDVPDATSTAPETQLKPMDSGPEEGDPGPMGPDGVSFDGSPAEPDTAEVNGGDTGPEEGGFGWPCSTPGDCLSGFCVPSQEGLVCTDFCVDSCPAGWTCSFVTGGGADTQFICVQRTLNLCRPCLGHAECATVDGVFDDFCVSFGEVEGKFCGTACSGHDDCPSGFQWFVFVSTS